MHTIRYRIMHDVLHIAAVTGGMAPKRAGTKDHRYAKEAVRFRNSKGDPHVPLTTHRCPNLDKCGCADLGISYRVRGLLHLLLRWVIVVTMPKNALAARATIDERMEKYRSTKVGPRVKMAARLYASGAVKSKKAACEAVGLTPTYLSILSREAVSHPEIVSIIGEIDHAIHDKTVALSTVIALAARRAVEKVNKLMDSQNEHISLKAASDILDRHPETSKTQKLQVTSFSLDSKDAKDIALALVRGAEVRERFAAIAEGDFVKIGDENVEKLAEQNLGEHSQSGTEASGPGSAGEGPGSADEDGQASSAGKEVQASVGALAAMKKMAGEVEYTDPTIKGD